ncbi:MAG: hypothetical protein JWM16_791 [Verrucomicrobiales bacterium]|nr:hypothetical protein [Verrucomicrobiales bacterium]
MNDCWLPEVELELDPIPPRLELRGELEELDPVVSLLEDELVFCAHAVPAMSTVVMQNREVLSNAFFIVTYFLLFVVSTHSVMPCRAKSPPNDGQKSFRNALITMGFWHYLLLG